MITKKSMFLLFILSFSLVSSFGVEFCSAESKFIVECTLPEQYFIQSFTCLNTNCTTRIENQITHQNLIIPNKNTSIILQKQINLKELQGQYTILPKLCEEKMSKATLEKIISKINSSLNEKNQTISFHMKPKEISKVLDAYSKEEKTQKILHECLIQKTILIDNWIIETKEAKPYCKQELDKEKHCIEITIKKNSFLIYLFSNPNKYSIPYLISLFLILIIIGHNILVFREMKNHSKRNEIFKITNFKLIFILTSIIPLTFLIGNIIHIIFYELLLKINPYLIVLISFLISIIITIILSVIVEYYKKHK